MANDQRKVVYQQRTELMGTEDLSAAIRGIREEAVGTLMDQYMPRTAAPSDWDLDGLTESISKDFNAKIDPKAWLVAEPELEEPVFRERVLNAVNSAYDQKVERTDTALWRHLEKDVMLRTLDQHWRDHLAAMDYLRQGIHLRGYAQQDYRFAYKREAFELFEAMLGRVKFDTVSVLAKIEVRTQEEIEREEEERRQHLMRALQAQHAEVQSALTPGELELPAADGAAIRPQGAPLRGLTGPGIAGGAPGIAGGAGRGGLPPPPAPDPQSTFVRGERKIGRNEPCPCGSGKKYKHCHGQLSSVG